MAKMSKTPRGNATVPQSKGKFNREVFERCLKAVRRSAPQHSPYRAVGEGRSESVWGRDRALEDLKGLDS